MKVMKFNGNDYAWDILKRNSMDVHALLKASHNQESVWLELKADPFCRRDCPNGPTDEAIWHTLKAIVAMVNTRGGCVVFGLDDKTHKPDVKLYDNKKNLVTNNRDEFHRNITEVFLRVTERRTGLKIKGQEYVLSKSIEPYCELRSGVVCDGKLLSVLLVKPSDGDDFVWVTKKTRGNREKKELFVRLPGDNGMIKSLDSDEIRAWVRPKLVFDDEAREKTFDNMLSPVPEFVGREDVLKEIGQCFWCVDKWVVPLLYGSAGVGKSEIAYKFAADQSLNYDTLIRVDASSCTSIIDVFAQIATNPDFRRVLLKGGHYDDIGNLNSEDSFMVVREAIAEGRLGRVLMVIDDVRDPDVVRYSIINRYLGRICESGLNIIATTRYPLLKFLDGEMIVPIEVRPLSESDGVSILRRKRALVNEQDSNYAEAIVRLVGGNPWAIDIVGEYLKQKRLQSESDYEQCLRRLQNGIAEFFPPKEYGNVVVGNATGVIDVGSLLGPTVSKMQSEERAICTLIAMSWMGQGPEIAFRSAFERLYGRLLQDEEWRFYIETLKRKCLIRESTVEAGYDKLFLNDSLLAGYFKSASQSNRFIDAFLEYIRVANRVVPADMECARYYWCFLINSNSTKERIVEIAFDSKRCGWPLYVMGVDVREAIEARPDRQSVFGSDGMDAILDFADDVPSLKADVLEIKYLNDGGYKANQIREVLELRERLYAEDPIMLGRSYLHAAEMGVGDIIDLRDRIQLLEKAEESFSHASGCNADVAKTLRRKAEAYQEYVDDPRNSREDAAEWKNGISDCLYRAKELWPAVFDDLYESDIDIDSYIEDGVCP